MLISNLFTVLSGVGLALALSGVALLAAPPYMTPWAVEGLEGLGLWAAIVPGEGPMMMRGTELLHLVGNRHDRILAAVTRLRRPISWRWSGNLCGRPCDDQAEQHCVQARCASFD